MKIIIEENKTRIRLNSQVIDQILAGKTFTFHKDNSNGFLHIDVNIKLSDQLTISKNSQELHMGIDQQTIDFISLKENKKDGLFIEDHNIYLQLDAHKKK